LKDALVDSININKELGYELLNSSTARTMGGYPAYSLMYRNEGFNEDRSTYIQTNMELGTLVDNRLYEIRFSSDAKDFDTYLPVAQKIIQSFEIKH
jgi:hypothetical protein